MQEEEKDEEEEEENGEQALPVPRNSTQGNRGATRRAMASRRENVPLGPARYANRKFLSQTATNVSSTRPRGISSSEFQTGRFFSIDEREETETRCESVRLCRRYVVC